MYAEMFLFRLFETIETKNRINFRIYLQSQECCLFLI